MTLGERIKAVCEERGVSLNELAEMTSVSRRHLASLANDHTKQPGLFKAAEIAHALDVPLDYLLVGVNYPGSNGPRRAGSKRLTRLGGWRRPCSRYTPTPFYTRALRAGRRPRTVHPGRASSLYVLEHNHPDRPGRETVGVTQYAQSLGASRCTVTMAAPWGCRLPGLRIRLSGGRNLRRRRLPAPSPLAARCGFARRPGSLQRKTPGGPKPLRVPEEA